MSNVYVQTKKINDINLIVKIASDSEDSTIVTLPDIVLVDSGDGNKYSHASTSYLDGPLQNNEGLYQYKLIGNNGIYKIVLLTAEELKTEKAMNSKKLYLNADYLLADGLANKIVIEEEKDKTLEPGFNFVFIALFDNDPTKPTTINDIPYYKENTKEYPEIKENQAYSAWYDADNKCYYMNI